MLTSRNQKQKWAAVCIALLMGLASTAGVRAQTPPSDTLTLNFVNADIEDVARTLAILSGKNVVVDPKVKGKIDLITDTPVGANRAIEQFATALRLRNWALIQSDGLLKVVPEAEAKLLSESVLTQRARTDETGQVVTRIFKLRQEQASNLVAVLRPLIGPNNTINVSPGSNALIITDYAENIDRLAKIIAALDADVPMQLQVIPIQHGLAADIVATASVLLNNDNSPTPAKGRTPVTSAPDVTLLADTANNLVILQAPNQNQIARAARVIELLDIEGGDRGNIHVVHLKNAKATTLATTLRAALSTSATVPSTGAAKGAASGGATASTNTSTGGQIQADEATNSLIITASASQMRQLRQVINQLDGRRAQVFVESLIAEVNAEKAAEFGIQWQGSIGNNGDSVLGLLGTNYGSGGANIINLATNGVLGSTVPTNGLNVGAAFKKNGVYVLGFLGRFLKENGDANILSTPTLLTLDNEEAKIVIGKNVPFVTGQYTANNSNGGSVNPFQTIERKDVGLTLKVKPQISENGTIKLDIYQEVSNVSETTSEGLVTNKRSIESSVLVDDGQIIVLGGLLQDEYSNGQQGTPGLADLPGIGQLFKSENRSRKKTNLMVFLRPVIIRDAADSQRLSLDRYDAMRSAQQQSQPAPSGVLGINASPVLPPVRDATTAQPAN